MEKLTEFKDFVKKNPELVKFVNEEKMTWQKFYEMYDLYGESHDVWKEYLNVNEAVESVATAAASADLFGWLKNIDLDTLQESINSIQRVVGVLQDFGSNKETVKPEYKPRPVYKSFED